MKNWTDEEIIFCLQGEFKKREQALKELYSRLFPTIKSYIQKNNGTDEDAADIFQDAMVVFYEKVRLHQFQLTSSIRTYIYSVCRHLWLNKLRAQKKVISLTDEGNTINIKSDNLDILGTKEKNQNLIKILETLGEDCKKVLVLYYFERLRMKEIAEVMNFANDQVAKNKKSSCLKKLKVIVAESPKLRDLLQ